MSRQKDSASVGRGERLCQGVNPVTSLVSPSAMLSKTDQADELTTDLPDHLPHATVADVNNAAESQASVGA